MATSKKTIVASPKKRAVVKRVQKSIGNEILKKETPKKRVAKKIVADKNIAEEISETIIAPSLKVKKPPKEEVVLPKNASLRSQDKANALASFIEHLEQPFYIIAYVSAVCFMVVGMSFIASSHFNNPNTQLAQLLTSTTSLAGIDINSGTSGSGSSNDPTINTVTQILDLTPTFELLESLPSVIDNEIRITMTVANSSYVQVKAYSDDTSKSYSLQTERVSNTSWRFYIPAKSFLAGDYTVRLQATANDGSGVHSFTVGSFTRPESTQTTTNISGTSNTTSTSGGTASSSTSVTANDDVSDTPNEQIIDDEISTSTPIAIAPVPVTDTLNQFLIVQPNSVLSDYEAIRIYAPENYSKIEVYARPALSTQSIFVGSAFKNQDRWSLAFNTNNIPNGNYQLHAVATYQTQRIYSKSVPVSVYNEPFESIVIDDYTDEEIKPIALPISTTSSSIERSFYSYETDTTFVPVSEESEEAEEKTVSLLENQKDEINDLLKNYAVASQSDSDLLNHTLNQDFDFVRESILKDLIKDESSEEQIEQIDNALKARFEDLQKRVDAFEELRSSRTSSDIANDSDQDGISDFDEVEVYNTDPFNPDTDNDGFLDGIEIIRGFNPLDEQSEATVEFELPQTTIGLAREDILVVHQVRPLIENDESLETPKVQTEITGKGLPNSFVTIYIFSTPTIVTIKTDADGSFTYTFDKELEDGEHEVYVAFTDNTGSIMAHSEPFRFVKEAEAFTPVGAAEDDLVTAPSLIEDSRADQTNTVIGLGILAFGIILLMLGMSIRTKKTELEQSTI